jgi:hypothetical protein
VGDVRDAALSGGHAGAGTRTCFELWSQLTDQWQERLIRPRKAHSMQAAAFACSTKRAQLSCRWWCL